MKLTLTSLLIGLTAAFAQVQPVCDSNPTCGSSYLSDNCCACCEVCYETGNDSEDCETICEPESCDPNPTCGSSYLSDNCCACNEVCYETEDCYEGKGGKKGGFYGGKKGKKGVCGEE